MIMAKTRVAYRELLLLLSLLQLLVNTLGKSSDLERGKYCPAWKYLDYTNSCVCGNFLRDVIFCDHGNYLYIRGRYCIMHMNEKNSTLIGSCPYSYEKLLQNSESELNPCGYRELLQNNESTLKMIIYSVDTCIEKVDFVENVKTTILFQSTLTAWGCVQCKSFKYGWIKFITVAFIPLTVFYILVIIFRISATLSTLNGYVLVNQIIATPAVIQSLYTNNQVNPYYYVSKSTNLFVNLGIVIYTIWNLDFFRSFYSPICLHPHITYPQVLLLDYAVAVYPMLLIFITYILVKMHDNYAFIVKLWRPFHRCLFIFRKQWNIHSSLVN